MYTSYTYTDAGLLLVRACSIRREVRFGEGQAVQAAKPLNSLEITGPENKNEQALCEVRFGEGQAVVVKRDFCPEPGGPSCQCPIRVISQTSPT